MLLACSFVVGCQIPEVSSLWLKSGRTDCCYPNAQRMQHGEYHLVFPQNLWTTSGSSKWFYKWTERVSTLSFLLPDLLCLFALNRLLRRRTHELWSVCGGVFSNCKTSKKRRLSRKLCELWRQKILMVILQIHRSAPALRWRRERNFWRIIIAVSWRSASRRFLSPQRRTLDQIFPVRSSLRSRLCLPVFLFLVRMTVPTTFTCRNKRGRSFRNIPIPSPFIVVWRVPLFSTSNTRDLRSTPMLVYMFNYQTIHDYRLHSWRDSNNPLLPQIDKRTPIAPPPHTKTR